MSTHAMDERLALRADRKVIIHKSGGEVSSAEQDTNENVSTAYSKFIIIVLRF